MKPRFIIVTLFCSATLYLVGGSAVFAQRGTRQASAASKRANDLALVLELQKTAHLLSKANRDYQGHRAAAVKEIHHAIHHLKAEAKVKAKGAGSDYTGPEPQPVSDTQLKQAIANLKSIQDKISSLPATTHRGKASGHLVNATKELATALEVVAAKNG